MYVYPRLLITERAGEITLCKRTFLTSNARVRSCTRRCGAQEATDAQISAGNRSCVHLASIELHAAFELRKTEALVMALRGG